MSSPLPIPVRVNVQHYGDSKWSDMRSIIKQLYIDESRSVPTVVEILSLQHDFHVNYGMLTYNIGKWGLIKNFNKHTVKHLLQLDPEDFRARILDSATAYRFLRAAQRLNIAIPRSHSDVLTAIGRNLSLPDMYQKRKDILTFVSDYVDKSFISKTWVANDTSHDITKDYLGWIYNSPAPDLYQLSTYMLCGDLCYRLEKKDWGDTLLQAGFQLLGLCISTQSFQVLQIVLQVLMAFGKSRPEKRGELLEICRQKDTLSGKSELHPIMRIFSYLVEIEKGKYGPDYYHFMFADAMVLFTDRLQLHLDANNFALQICNLVNQLQGLSGPRTGSMSPGWIHPQNLWGRNPKFFESENNIAHLIVLAFEFYGHSELIQIEDTLRHVLNFGGSEHNRRMISRHLQMLERPIHRIAYRDILGMGCVGDRHKFMEHWKKAIADPNGDLDGPRSVHLLDKLIGYKAFKEWGMPEEEKRIEDCLNKSFAIWKEQLKKQSECALELSYLLGI